MNNQKYVALIPLRAGSKGIPGKNIKSLRNKRLYEYCLDACYKSNLFFKIFISTDSVEIINIISEYTKRKKYNNVEIILRPPNLARDETSTEEVIMHTIKYLSLSKDDIFYLIQATNVFLRADDIKNSSKLMKSDCSIVSVTKEHRFIWSSRGEPLNYNPSERPRRQDWEGILFENGSFYCSTIKMILNSKCRISGNIKPFLMHSISKYEIDEPFEWDSVEAIVKYAQKIEYW